MSLSTGEYSKNLKDLNFPDSFIITISSDDYANEVLTYFDTKHLPVISEKINNSYRYWIFYLAYKISRERYQSSVAFNPGFCLFNSNYIISRLYTGTYEVSLVKGA